MVVVKRFGVLQMAKIMGVLYFLMSAIFFIPAGLFMLLMGGLQGQEGLMGGAIGGIGMFFLPVFYGVGGFIGGALLAAIYNVVAGFVGGIEVEVEQ